MNQVFVLRSTFIPALFLNGSFGENPKAALCR